MELLVAIKPVPSDTLKVNVTDEIWRLRAPFRIARGVRSEARIVMVTVTDGIYVGRGEAVPSRRYNESVSSAREAIDRFLHHQNASFDRAAVQAQMPPGAARNAVDCALWDLSCKQAGRRAWDLVGLPAVDEITTAFTISLDSPEVMATAAKAASHVSLLKLKLGGDASDLDRVQAVHEAVPSARLVVDANESWSPDHFAEVAQKLPALRVELIEQPFPASQDEVLRSLPHPVPVCADESCHTTADLPRLTGRYEAVNIKLDKTGGLTEALHLLSSAREKGFRIFAGCMVCTSLGIAPARLLASVADYVDLDGPLLLANDRPGGIKYVQGRMSLPAPELWG